MKIKAITDYYDLELDRAVKRGEEIEVSDARAKVLCTTENPTHSILCEKVTTASPTPKRGGRKQKEV